MRCESAARAEQVERLSAALPKAAEENALAQLAAEELQTEVRARDAAMRYESARGEALEGGFDALSLQLRTLEASDEARVAAEMVPVSVTRAQSVERAPR